MTIKDGCFVEKTHMILEIVVQFYQLTESHQIIWTFLGFNDTIKTWYRPIDSTYF